MHEKILCDQRRHASERESELLSAAAGLLAAKEYVSAQEKLAGAILMGTVPDEDRSFIVFATTAPVAAQSEVREILSAAMRQIESIVSREATEPPA